MTAKFLHGEIREKGGAYGGGARMGGGLFSFYSYRWVFECVPHSFCFQCKYLRIFYFAENILKTADLWLFIRHLFFFNPDIPLVNVLLKVSQVSFASIESSFLPKSLPQMVMYITIFGYDKYEIKERIDGRKGLNFSSVLFNF